jgi:endonuclease I
MFLLMSRVSHFIALALFICALAQPALAGSEDFANFPETESSYGDGTFTGQDGSTWTYLQCRGNKVIDAPTPGLNDEVPLAYVASGTIAGGCGILSFEYKQLFTHTSVVDVVVNDSVRYTLNTPAQNVTNQSGDLAINVGGNFTLKFIQNNNRSGQVAIDNVVWTPYGGADPEPPEVLFVPNTNSLLTEHSSAIGLEVTATEPNEDATRLWVSGLPSGASFSGATGLTPLASTFAWTPTESQTGLHSVIFYAGDKDGTNSRTFSIEVTPIYPYYYYAEGLTGAALKAKLHEIISTGTYELEGDGPANELDPAMADIHTDPANANNVLLLYNPTSSVPKSTYNDTGGWNKEHCWPDSRGLGDGPDGVDVHNLYAANKDVNNLRGNLFFNESDPADGGYVSPAHADAPETSMDINSWEPPDASKGNVARALFYMATRYDGDESDTTALAFADEPTVPNVSMGILTTLLAWHLSDPPDAAESNRNEKIFTTYQFNRNPFIDRPQWAEDIWGTDVDGDGSTATYEAAAGTDPANSNSFLQTSIVHTNSSLQMGCGLLTAGSTWRLYQGAFVSNDIVWQAIAETNRLQGETVQFNIAPTSRAAFYHLRALQP